MTGASSGLGREIARQLVLDHGYRVLATARRLDLLEQLRDEMPLGSMEIMEGDLSDPNFRESLWAWAEADRGRIDLLVNNAGLGNYADFGEQDFEVVRQLVEVNLMALMDLTQRAIRHMRIIGKGQILQISSTLGFVAMPYAAVYNATKHAVNGLVKTLRYELRDSGVRVWAACPSRIRTDFRTSALGRDCEDHARLHGESVESVARGILRGLKSQETFRKPTWNARLVVGIAHWLPGPFEWFMIRWAPAHFAREIGRV
ncbi:SDR family NAD(P)-dependent oxidoreductase [Tundrisphaera lichenicola]|uniref:SDR family NAD(P)-dependent oxidoreductase n=1 Tax=Tundrisphaera lichenicola TaxID=2029860 RepID=UPI003EBC69C2